jgi:hypothetical protein
MRKSSVVVSVVSLILLVLLTACGGGSHPTVSIAGAPGSNTVDAGSSPVVLTAAVASDPKNGGVTWTLSSATCGSLSSATTTSVTYTAPSAQTLDADCTATITATSITDPTRSKSLVLTIKAITVTVVSSAGGTTTFGSGSGQTITLTATLNNEASGASDSVTWSASSAAAALRRKANAVHPNIAVGSCGTFASSGNTATYMPGIVSADCTETITAASTINPNQKSVTTFTVKAIAVAVTQPAAPVTEFVHQGTVPLAATITNDASNGGAGSGVVWSLNPPSGCGTITGSGLSVTYNPPAAPAASCSVTATATSVEDPTQSASSPLITINPNIAVSITSPPATSQVASGDSVTVTATISNDLNSQGIGWTISPATGCGTLTAIPGSSTSIKYTAPLEANLPAACTATVKATSVADPTYQPASASVQITANPISVSAITAAIGATNLPLPATVGQASAAITLADTISFDTATHSGLTWTLTQASTCGALGTASVSGSTSTITFTPAASVAANCLATIEVLSVKDPSKNSSTTITVTPLTVSITTPSTSSVNVTENATQSLVATVVGDVANAGVTWTLAPASGCGSLSASSSASGVAITFTAPATTCSATATATSVTDTSKTASVVLNVVAPVITVTFTNAGPWTVDASNTNGTSTFTSLGATITNDVSSQGISWSSSNAVCGTIASSNNGANATFTAAQDNTLTQGQDCLTTITAASVADPTKKQTGQMTVNSISVSISPSGNQGYQPGAANANFSVTVSNDALSSVGTSGVGVTWSLSNPGCGSLSNQTLTSVTFVVPGTACSASTNLVATSNADNTKSSSDTITVSSASPLSISTQNNNNGSSYGLASEPFAVYFNVQGGVQPYTLSTASGTIPPGMAYSTSNSNTLLGGTPTTAGTYTFTVKVTDSVGATATSSSVTVVIGAAPNHQHDARLNGPYVCRSTGFVDNNTGAPYPWASLSSTKAGTGGAFSGIVDLAFGGAPAPGVDVPGTQTGTVNVGLDNHGILTTSTTLNGIGTFNNTFAIEVNNVAGTLATEFKGIEIDDLGDTPSGTHGSLTCYLATTSAFTTSNVNGHSFAFGMGGVDNSGSAKDVVGVYSASGGNITTGEIDQAKADGTSKNQTFTGGTYTTPDSTTGRYVAAVAAGGGTEDLITYTIDANRGFVLAVSATGNEGFMSGNVRKQLQTSYSNASLNGPFVAYENSAQYSGSPLALTDASSFLMQATGTSTGFTANWAYSDEAVPGGSGTLTSQLPITLPVAFASNGRATIVQSNGTLYFYFYDKNSALLLDTTGGSLGLGWVENQTATSGTSITGSYVLSKLPALNPNSSDSDGMLTLSGGVITGINDDAGQGFFDWAQPINQGGGTITYSGPGADGVVTITDTGGGGKVPVGIAITATKIALISKDSDPNIMILEK